MGRVSGKVIYNGKPVSPGSVMFTPIGGSSGDSSRIATGQLGEDGSFTLTTFDAGDGAVLCRTRYGEPLPRSSRRCMGLSRRRNGASLSRTGTSATRF
jgi:hypothetical protein